MKNERDPWIRVKDESELREGMAVQMRPCRWCGRTDTFWLGERFVGTGIGREPDGSLVPTGDRFAWEYKARVCRPGRIDSGYLGDACREGRVYRLADDQLADDAEPATVVRGREMERAR